MELGANAAIHLRVLGWCIELCPIVLVPEVSNHSALNAFGNVLLFQLCGIQLILCDHEAVHLRAQTNELENWLASCLILHLAKNLVVLIRIVWRVLCETGEVVGSLVSPHVVENVLSLDLVHQRVGISEEQLSTILVLLLDDVVVEAVHEQLRQIEYCESNIEGLVDLDFDFPKLHPNQVLLEDSIVDAVRFVG